MQLDEAECVRLISAGGVGRLAYSARSGMAILPVSFRLHEGSIVFPTWMRYPSRRRAVKTVAPGVVGSFWSGTR